MEFEEQLYDSNEFEEFQNKPSVWYRFWARLIDTWFITSIVLIAIIILQKNNIVHDTNVWINLISTVLAIVVNIIYETFSIAFFGTTVGKKLLGIRIIKVDGLYLGLRESFIRSLKVFVMGMGFRIPIVSFVTTLLSFLEYNKSQTTFWDLNQPYYVYVRRKRKSGFVAVVVTSVFIGVLIINMGFNKILSQMNDLFLHPTSSYNEEGYGYMLEGEYEKAKDCFLTGVEMESNSYVIDALYNNLSWVCYELGDYEEALRYSELSIGLESNEAIEFVNYGNALDILGRTEEAEKAYKNALELEEIKEAYYGLGTVYFDKDQYEEAIDCFEKYLQIEEDEDAYSYLALAVLYGQDDKIKAEEYLNKASEMQPDSTSVLEAWGAFYTYLGEYDAAIDIYKKELADNGDDYDVLYLLADAYANAYQDDLAFETLEMAIAFKPKEVDAYILKAKMYYWLDDISKMNETVDQMLETLEASNEANRAAGDIYYNSSDYLKASSYYEKAIKLDGKDEESYIGNIASLYYGKRYTRCLNIAEEADKLFDNHNIPWYIAFVHSDVGKHEEAINYYKQALELLPDDIDLLTNIGWEYYTLQDYEVADSWLVKALIQNNAYENALALEDALLLAKESSTTQISEFIEDNYLYFKSNQVYEDAKARIIRKENPTVDDVYDLVSTVYDKNDMFTFILSGNDYIEYVKMLDEISIEYKPMDHETEYIKITSFLPNTFNDFVDIVETMKNTDEKTLIIDLRDNYGGDTLSGCNILDLLLGDCVVCNLIYKDGYTNQYYSDANQVKFKQIVVLTNENSASCAELVTLGLKTYLDNVTIIGNTTYGKGVGQIGFEDKSQGLVFFLVNHYWNVRETNIMDIGIKPDIECKSNDLKDYLAFIKH